MKSRKALALLVSLVFILTVFLPSTAFAGTSIHLHATGTTAYVVLHDSSGPITEWAGETSSTGTYLMASGGIFTLSDNSSQHTPFVKQFILDNVTYVVNPPEDRSPLVRVGEEGNLGNGTNNYWIDAFVADPSISLTKVADVDTGLEVGDTVTYTLTATNTGNVSLDNVTISDAGIGVSSNLGTVVPGGVVSTSGTHVINEADLLNGFYTNNAEVKGTPGGLDDVTDTATETVYTVQAFADIDLQKTADITTGYEEGDTVDYVFTVENTGNVTLNSVTLNDSGIGLVSSLGTMAPGVVMTVAGSHVITEGDFLAGSYTNVATASGISVGSLGTVTDTDTETVYTIKAAPSISLEKEADVDTGLEVGDTVTYTFTITNNGNSTLYDVVMTDAGLGVVINAGTLPSGAVYTGSGIHVITLWDLYMGRYDNMAEVQGRPAERPFISSRAYETVYTVASRPGITIDKTIVGDPATVYDAGDTIHYEFTVTNTGNIPLYYVYISDAGLDVLTGGTMEIMDPGVVFTAAGTYVVQQGDIDAGPTYDNTAWAYGDYGPGAHDKIPEGTVSDSDSASALLFRPAPGVSITKTSEDYPEGVTAGETINYEIVVTNTGNVPIWGRFTDPLLGINEYFALEVGASTTPTPGTYITDSGDVPSVTNTAYVYLWVEVLEGQEEPDDSSTVTVPVYELPPPPTPTPPPPTPTPPPPNYNPDIGVTITPDATYVEVDTEVNFTMVVTNLGNTILNNVEVVNTDLGFSTTIPTLYVAGSETFVVPKVMTESGDFNFVVTAEGTSPQVVAVNDTDLTAVEVYEIVIPPPPEPPPENPPTGAIPFDIYSVSGLLAMGAGVFALIKRKKEDDEDED